MKSWVVNSFVTKKSSTKRYNFYIRTDKSDVSEIKQLIIEELKINPDWEVDTEEFEVITKESVIKYDCTLKKKKEEQS